MIEELKNTFDKFNKKISSKDKIAHTRLDIFNAFTIIGFPGKSLEDWKFSNFNKIISKFNNIRVNLDEKTSDSVFDFF